MTGGARTDLGGRVALVTGSSRGLGAALVRRLAGMGATPVVTFRRERDAAEEVASELRVAGGEAYVHELDVGDVDSIADLFSWLTSPDGPGRLDIVVANAAATAFKPLLEQRAHNVERTFAVSVTGFLELARSAVPLMAERGGGRIVAVSGVDTRGYGPGHGLLAAAKAAMEMLVQYLQVELAGTGVTVIGVNPDAFHSAGPALMFGELYERVMGVVGATHPYGRVAQPDEVAEAVALCCTDAATWMAGTTVQMDGGSMFAKSGRLVELAMHLDPDALASAASALAPAPLPRPGEDPDEDHDEEGR